MQFLDAAFKAHLRLDEPQESQVIDASKWHNRLFEMDPNRRSGPLVTRGTDRSATELPL
jgi:hypothetical protein